MRVFRSSWVSYESHLRVSSGWLSSIFGLVVFRVIGLGISSSSGQVVIEVQVEELQITSIISVGLTDMAGYGKSYRHTVVLLV